MAWVRPKHRAKKGADNDESGRELLAYFAGRQASRPTNKRKAVEHQLQIAAHPAYQRYDNAYGARRAPALFAPGSPPYETVARSRPRDLLPPTPRPQRREVDARTRALTPAQLAATRAVAKSNISASSTHYIDPYRSNWTPARPSGPPLRQSQIAPLAPSRHRYEEYDRARYHDGEADLRPRQASGRGWSSAMRPLRDLA